MEPHSNDKFYEDTLKRERLKIENLENDNKYLRELLLRIVERSEVALANQDDNYGLAIGLTMIRQWAHTTLEFGKVQD